MRPSAAKDFVFDGELSEVVEFYEGLRYALYQNVSKEFDPFYATPISYNDCLQADSWSKIDSRGRNDWYWKQAYTYYQKYFKRFDIAFKQNNRLVSLTYGMPTAHRTGLKLDLIESTPFKMDKLGLSGLELVTYAAQTYATMLGANEIRIMNPTSKGVQSYYESAGFKYISNKHKPSRPHYCVMKLR